MLLSEEEPHLIDFAAAGSCNHRLDPCGGANSPRSHHQNILRVRPLPNFPSDGEIFSTEKVFDNMPLFSPEEVTSLDAGGGDDDASALETGGRASASATKKRGASSPRQHRRRVVTTGVRGENAWAHYGGEDLR